MKCPVTAKELCDIIKTSQRHNVSVLQFAGIRIEFVTGNTQEATTAVIPEYIRHADVDNSETPKLDLTPEQKDIMREWEMQDTAIRDPMSYETHMIDELLHGGVSSDA